MAEIGKPIRRRILIPDDLPVETPAPTKPKPLPAETPEEKEPA